MKDYIFPVIGCFENDLNKFYVLFSSESEGTIIKIDKLGESVDKNKYKVGSNKKDWSINMFTIIKSVEIKC